MSTLLQQLPLEIERLESERGSANPYVRQLKEQQRAMQDNDNRSTQEVWRMQAFQFDPPSSEPETEADGPRAQELRIAKLYRNNPKARDRALAKIRASNK